MNNEEQKFNKMNEISKSVSKENLPEFQELLDSFKHELIDMDENAAIINKKVNSIKERNSTVKVQIQEEVICGGVLGELWECVWRMGEYNALLNESRISLIKLIG